MTGRTPASRREAAAGVSRVVGTPAAGLGPSVTEADGPWWARSAGAARVGAVGEIRTAQLLEPFTLTADGPTVLHDLLIPGLGRLRANIDHVVVSGQTVLLVDSKVWAPGFVWTVFGRSWGTCPGSQLRTARPSWWRGGGSSGTCGPETCLCGCRPRWSWSGHPVPTVACRCGLPGMRVPGWCDPTSFAGWWRGCVYRRTLVWWRRCPDLSPCLRTGRGARTQR